MVCGGEKKSITKTTEKGGRRKVWALRVVSRAVDRQGSGEISLFIVLVSTDTIWRGLYCLKLWVNDIWEAGVRHNSPVPPPDPKSSCESTEQLFCFFKRQQPPSPSLIHCLFFLPPSLPLPCSRSLSLFFSLFLRHSLVTAWSSNRTTLFLNGTESPEIPRGAQWVPTPKMKKKKVVL